MKKVLSTLALIFVATSFAMSGADSDSQTIAIARAALKSTCDDVNGDLSASVNVVGACFIDGFIKEVTFYRPVKCPPNMICIQMIALSGVVTLDCDNNVIGVQCGSAATL